MLDFLFGDNNKFHTSCAAPIPGSFVPTNRIRIPKVAAFTNMKLKDLQKRCQRCASTLASRKTPAFFAMRFHMHPPDPRSGIGEARFLARH